MQAMRRRLPKPQRRGFTLIELLVVISIIAVLMALILPGINGARRTARRMQCMNNMRNVSTAMQVYSTSRNELPWLTTDLTQGNVGVWNGDDGTNVLYAPAPWSVLMLPYIEQEDLFDRITTGAVGGPVPTGETETVLKNTLIEVYTCPDDPNADTGGTLSWAVNAGYTTSDNWLAAQAGTWNVGSHELRDYLFSFDNYNAAGGGVPTLDSREVQAATGVFVEQSGGGGYKATIDRMKDGQTQTILLTEGLQMVNWHSPHPRQVAIFAPLTGTLVDDATPVPAQYSDLAVDPINGLGPDATALPPNAKSLALTIGAPNLSASGLNARINDNPGAQEGLLPRPSSNHANVVNVMYADGHGGPLSEDVTDFVYLRLLTSNGGKLGQQVLSDSDF